MRQFDTICQNQGDDYYTALLMKVEWRVYSQKKMKC